MASTYTNESNDMSMKQIMMCLFMFALMSFTGCEREELINPAKPSQLTGTWRLVAPTSPYAITLQLAVNVTASTTPGVTPFDATGQSAVNNYFTLLTASADGTMTMGVIGATKKAGPADAMQFEQTYFSNLRTVTRYELTNQNRLRLYYGDNGANVLIYERDK
ncbi:META domain-containing protein [Fibrisoma montanum]|uniref:META domain-containing protein n=2 Tax=Fibrisoma montanum TaxID=2305895 RepID=A0A418LY10_9BACT|nr:META domain-containing protein [Fibrisoma montanum]